MKLNGIKINTPNRKTIVFPRETGNLVFVFQAVLDSKKFEEVFSPPQPPVKKLAGGEKVAMFDDSDYRKKMQEWGTAKHHWCFLTSISSTPGLEWETVDFANPNTWGNYEQELAESGLTEAERLRLMQAYIEVQGLNDEKIREATESFLAGHQEEKASE
jgi:hypothetical protein